jgi:hypothetical protein
MSYGTVTLPPPRQFNRPPPGPAPAPIPGQVPGTLLHDSAIHTQLHNGIVRTVTREGLYECRASGNPRIRTNTDRTFSLLCDAGHGRFYTYVPNYNVYMVLVAGWGNQVAGQDISLKIRSRHNESDPCNNRFGGYGWAADRGGWSAKIEPCHNNHTSVGSGGLPLKLITGQYYTFEFSVKDEGTGVRQINKINGTQVFNKIIPRQAAPYTLFQPRSYVWVRQNVDSGTGELRIKNLKLYAI